MDKTQFINALLSDPAFRIAVTSIILRPEKLVRPSKSHSARPAHDLDHATSASLFGMLPKNAWFTSSDVFPLMREHDDKLFYSVLATGKWLSLVNRSGKFPIAQRTGTGNKTFWMVTDATEYHLTNQQN